MTPPAPPPGRPGLQRALAAARAGPIDVLLVYRVDRLTRSLRDLVTLLDDLDRAGVVFRSATEPFDTATAMGRLLVQMLGMFAQFERDAIIDRVIARMERKAAAGKWKGGRRPFGYQVDATAQTLVADPREAAVDRLIFESYTRDRLGARNIATILNGRGHRTTASGRWSAHQVLRVLANRVYLGELTFRGITTTSCHRPIIDVGEFDTAQRILAARCEDHAKRAASGTDYLLTGLLRCPACGSAMIGTRAQRQDTHRPVLLTATGVSATTPASAGQAGSTPMPSNAVIHALTRFYRHQHDLIADAIAAADAKLTATHDGQRTELAATEHELATTRAAIGRYLAAFETGTLDPEDLASRARPAQGQVPAANRPARRTHQQARNGTGSSAARDALADRRPHRRGHRRRQR
jgi:site-specific DNA recombinase